ncbi:ABC transporter permease [Streptomyces sp. 8N706]|uniref:ABC transporter permease n=1 Tax=Streptomyces sp. 8N706 TaxID=3457416 RepID=UPI003FD0B7AF
MNRSEVSGGGGGGAGGRAAPEAGHRAPGPDEAGTGLVAPHLVPPRITPRITWQKVVTVPAFVAAALGATALYLNTTELDSIARNSLSGGIVRTTLREQTELVAISTFFVLVIAIPLGVALTRGSLRRAAPPFVAAANVGQATPALGLLALLVIWLGIGRRAALIGIVAFAVLSNTVAGLKAIDPALVEAARGIGMPPRLVLFRVELPLAVPLILAGVRTALVLNVGTATLATFGGGGGLGDLISSGITNQRMPVLVLGSMLTVAMALIVDWLGMLVELLLRPRGLEVD